MRDKLDAPSVGNRAYYICCSRGFCRESYDATRRRRACRPTSNAPASSETNPNQSNGNVSEPVRGSAAASVFVGVFVAVMPATCVTVVVVCRTNVS